MVSACSTALWLAVLWQLPLAQAKLEVGTARLSTSNDQPRWHYMGKFGYAIGAGTYDIRLRLRGPANLISVNLEVYLDEDWPLVESLPQCGRASRGPARKTHILRVSEEWGPWMGGVLEQTVRPHIWYFALSKCHGQGTATFDVDFELRSQQYDASELSVELRHMPCATVLAVLCLTGFFARFVVRCRRLRRSVGEVHPVIRALAAAVLLQWTAQVLHLLQLQLYERDGVGESSIDAAADILFMLSQVVSSTLLIVIAQGYTLGSKDGDLSAVKPVAAAIAVLHVVLVGHGKLQASHAEQHHENEGAVGWAILVLRLALFGWFAAGVQALRSAGSLRLQHFLQSFQVAGSLYFLSYPAIYTVVQAFAPYLQHPIMQIGLVAMQTTSAIWLSDLFLSRGAYFQVSTLNSSLLPGGIRCVPIGSKQD